MCKNPPDRKTELIVKIRNTIFGPGLWALAAGASALSLGNGSGTVVLGAPVDLSFELQPDPGTDVASSCVTAKLVAGDNVISDNKVRVVPLPEVRGRPSGVRVLASVSLDEPVLTVTLSAGCNGKTTRSYTFLSDLPTTVTRSASASPVDLARLPAVTSGAADASTATAGMTQFTRPGDKVSAAAKAVRMPAAGSRTPDSATAARPPTRVGTAAPGKSVVAAAPAARSRLVVEPLDTWLESPVALRSTAQLPTAPSEDMSALRAQAAALWKSLNAQPEDLQKDGDRLKALESDAAALRAQAAKDRAAAGQLQQQLDLMEQERFPATVVYALGGLLVLALAGVAWMWSRVRSASDKAVRSWRDSVALGARADAASAHDEVVGLTPHPGDTWLPSETQPHAVAANPESGAAPLHKAAPATVEPRFVATSPAASAPAPLQAKSVSAPPAASVVPHIVNPEELFDIQQQAEFFVSVGEHQQAIEVLKNHIAEHRETSPLAYLELLRLYHTLSRVDEFAQLRTQFMQSFNAQVPEFVGFQRTGRMLYHYTDALAEIEAEWTTPEVLGLLEKFLFRRTGAEAVEPFDLAAYDDLLLLLAIAQTTPASARGAAPPRKRTTPLAPPRSDTLVAPSGPAATPLHDDLPLDSLAASLEFEFAMKAQQETEPAPSAAVASNPPTAIGEDTLGIPLDLDLSDPPHLTLSDLPPVPVTSPPPAGQPVGFGMENDLMELRLELEQMKKTDRK